MPGRDQTRDAVVLISRREFSGEIRNDPDIAGAQLPVLCAHLRRPQVQLACYEAEAGPSERESPRSAPT
jgi:hypothetical protein